MCIHITLCNNVYSLRSSSSIAALSISYSRSLKMQRIRSQCGDVNIIICSHIILKETDSRSFVNFFEGVDTTCLALHCRELLCKPSRKNVKPHHRDSSQGPSAYWPDALTAALWCSSHPQQRKHDISPIYKTPRVSFLQSNVQQLGSWTKKVALLTIVCGLGPT